MELGDRVKYIKTHEGHLCTVHGIIHHHKQTKKIVSVFVRCDCGPYLYLNLKDVEAQDA